MNLENITFGNQVAENEASTLSSYFVETQAWKKLYDGDVDIVFGSKGAGKSALYTLLLENSTKLLDRDIFLLSAEKPTGKTVFSDIKNEPPTAEQEFIMLWKIYFCQLIVDWLIKNDLNYGGAKEVTDKLVECGLIEERNTLKRLLNSAKDFARNLFNIESLEGGATLEGITGKITFRTPSKELKQKGYISVDELLYIINEHLSEINKKCWILCDRLDVAFDQSDELEKNALRALFKSYRDMEEYDAISIKIFLRDDIWNRITKEGFREASHITKEVTISWSVNSLLNLIVSRALKNKEILDKYSVKSLDIMIDYERQKDFYYKMFPKQVDAGEKQSSTFDWILSRIKDGLGNTPPRELIHFYNESLAQELREQNIANSKVEEPNIVSKTAIKNSVYEVSKTRILKTIYAEYPNLQKYIQAFENKKAEHDLSTLCDIWEVDSDKGRKIANDLVEIGFFENRPARNEGIYKVPFIYRFHLNIIQGKAF